jgi:hypothetical protein
MDRSRVCSDEIRQNRTSELPEAIIVAIHGVGGPRPGEVVQEVVQGLTNARLNAEMVQEPTMVSLTVDGASHCYLGSLIAGHMLKLHVWEVNWADLKGLPSGALGSLLYALKAVVAMVQIADRGWEGSSAVSSNPLFFGAILHAYFCIFSLVSPLDLCVIAFAYMQRHSIISYGLIGLFLISASLVLWLLTSVDRWIRYSLFVLVIGVATAIWMVARPGDADRLLIGTIEIYGGLEIGLAVLLLLAGLELLARFGFAGSARGAWTTFATRSAVMVLGVAIGAGAYGALVNAIGLFLLSRLQNWHLTSASAIQSFYTLFLRFVGYDLATVELINGAATFLGGAFLVIGVCYQLLRISQTRGESKKARGRDIQNLLNAFIWLTIAGACLVMFALAADIFGFLDWLLPADQCRPLSPLEIYSASATRVVPFLLPVVAPSLRVGLNIAADVLLYILPERFPFSLRARSQDRFRGLFEHMQRQHPSSDLVVLAHSQGTVIARDVLRAVSDPPIGLVTVGSPLAPLYRRFLDIPVTALSSCRWTNIYRLSDYVGGPIRVEGIVDSELAADYRAAHFLYFQDGTVIDAALDNGRAAAGPVTRR